MVEIIGRLVNNTVRNDIQTTTFRIPALSKSGARARARANARVKGFSNFSVDRIERLRSGSIPGQEIYDVTIKTPQ